MENRKIEEINQITKTLYNLKLGIYFAEKIQSRITAMLMVPLLLPEFLCLRENPNKHINNLLIMGAGETESSRSSFKFNWKIGKTLQTLGALT